MFFLRTSGIFPPVLRSGSEVAGFPSTRFSVRNLGTHREAMEKLATADLCDEYMNEIAAGDVRILPPGFHMYGKRRYFSGSIVTTKVFEENVFVRRWLEERGDGKVLVVDGGGSLRCALLGGYLAAMGHKNGWSGIIVNGCIRDTDEINDCDIGVRALGSNPVKSEKKGEGDNNKPITVGGVRIVPGEWCYADSDGIIISKRKLVLSKP